MGLEVEFVQLSIYSEWGRVLPLSIGNVVVHVFIQYCPATGMQNGDEGLLRIILAGRGNLVKMFITLEPHGLFKKKICILTHLFIIETQVCIVRTSLLPRMFSHNSKNPCAFVVQCK